MFLEVHVGVVVGVDEFKGELVQFQHGADVQVAQRVVLGELDRIARLVRLLHPASLQELPASETCIVRGASNTALSILVTILWPV